jgi:hypothetical protein
MFDSNLLIYLGVAIVGALGGGYLYRKGNKLEEIRTEVLQLIGLLQKYGYTALSKILERVIVRDWDGAANAVKEALEMLRDEKKRRAHFKDVFLTTWQEMLNTWPDDELVPFVNAYKSAETLKSLQAEARRREAAAEAETAAEARAEAATSTATRTA